jgi:hypothetical protein
LLTILKNLIKYINLAVSDPLFADFGKSTKKLKKNMEGAL